MLPFNLVIHTDQGLKNGTLYVVHTYKGYKNRSRYRTNLSQNIESNQSIDSEEGRKEHFEENCLFTVLIDFLITISNIPFKWKIGHLGLCRIEKDRGL